MNEQPYINIESFPNLLKSDDAFVLRNIYYLVSKILARSKNSMNTLYETLFGSFRPMVFIKVLHMYIPETSLIYPNIFRSLHLHLEEEDFALEASSSSSSITEPASLFRGP